MNVATDMLLPCRWSAIEFRTANENKLSVSESSKYSGFSVMILQAQIGCEAVDIAVKNTVTGWAWPLIQAAEEYGKAIDLRFWITTKNPHVAICKPVVHR